MRRWNGWGMEESTMTLPDNGLQFLQDRIGPGNRLPDSTLAEVCASVPESRLPESALPGLHRDAETRVRHARGQSLPDLLAMRSGEVGVFPDGVAFPRSSGEVQAWLEWCAANDVVLIPYGGGTSVAGHINPQADLRPVLTLSLARMNQLLDLDHESQIATFGAGVAGPQLESQLRGHGYTLGHFPQSFELSTLGGWVASRSSGQQSLRYGRIEQLYAGGRMETPRGALALPTFPASSAGPDLREMVLGSEGRMGVITEVAVRVTRLAQRERFRVVVFPQWEQAHAAARELVQCRVPLSMLRLSNALETETQLALAGHPGQIAWLQRYLALRGATAGKCMMTLGVTGSPAQCRQAERQAAAINRQHGGISTGTLLGRKWAEKRFTMPYLREALWEQGYVVDTLETATDWYNVDHLLEQVEASLHTALRQQGCEAHVFTHLSHFYSEGCSIYTTYAFPNGASYEHTHARWAAAKQAASETIVRNHGTISHQHGVGKDHAPWLHVEKGAQGMAVLQHLAQFWDPAGRLNPGTLLQSPESLSGGNTAAAPATDLINHSAGRVR